MKTLTLLIKPASGNCNLRCEYCFYADIADIRKVTNYGIMSIGTLERLVSAIFSEVTDVCSIGFQGGEPTLAGLGFFHALIQFEKKYNQNNIKVLYSIQTNGLLLDDEWADFFFKNKFLVGLSIDARQSVHDRLRVDAYGKGTHNLCLKAARLLEKHKVEFNILSVVSKWLAACPDEAWLFYKQHNFRHLQFIPCLDSLNATNNINTYSPKAKIYGKFLCRIFDLWYEDWVQEEYISVRSFDNYLHMLVGLPPENCAMSGVCQPYALVEADGGVYPCDFYALDEYLLGNIYRNSFEEMLSSNVTQAFVSLSSQINPLCARCDYFPLCRGGCRRDREPIVDGVLSPNRYCAAYKMFFSHAMSRLSHLAYQIICARSL